MSFRTSKCQHGEKGMCIHCLVNKNKMQKVSQEPQESNLKMIECKHPSHMKCLRCLPMEGSKSTLSYQIEMCDHPDYQMCKKCQHYLHYDKFDHFCQKLAFDCAHKKPCSKCLPPLSRKTYFIDKDCKKHMPYPQAQCDACMAPTISIMKQQYSHVSKVVIRTSAIYKIVEAKIFAVLLGSVVNDVVYVDDLYFPEEQEPNSMFISPEATGQFSSIFEYFNLEEVGLLYCSSDITGMSLMISSLFQDRFARFENNHQISRFITMRLHFASTETEQPHFECFMVSDQFQSFHKNNIIYQNLQEQNHKHFDLVTAKEVSNLTELPTFLRNGVETDHIQFKEIIVWINNIAEQTAFCLTEQPSYPSFTLESQNLYHLRNYIDYPESELIKYKNIQFLLHLTKLMPKDQVMIFINEFYLYNPNIFLEDKLRLLEKLEEGKMREYEDPNIYKKKYMDSTFQGYK